MALPVYGGRGWRRRFHHHIPDFNPGALDAYLLLREHNRPQRAVRYHRRHGEVRPRFEMEVAGLHHHNLPAYTRVLLQRGGRLVLRIHAEGFRAGLQRRFPGRCEADVREFHLPRLGSAHLPHHIHRTDLSDSAGRREKGYRGLLKADHAGAFHTDSPDNVLFCQPPGIGRRSAVYAEAGLLQD